MTHKGGENMNEAKLREIMKQQNVTVREMCDFLHISRSAFYRKCKGKTEFTQGEIEGIVNRLKLNSPMGIFFEEKVS